MVCDDNNDKAWKSPQTILNLILSIYLCTKYQQLDVCIFVLRNVLKIQIIMFMY